MNYGVLSLVIITDPDFIMIVKATTAELGLPASFILCKVEDELQHLYLQVFTKTISIKEEDKKLHFVCLQSCILAEYLLSVQFMNLNSIADALDLHPHDIPLLLVSSTLKSSSPP